MRLISDTYNKTDLSLDGSGSLIIETIKEGSGTFPVSGSKVKIHYTGTFEDGTKFDSSYDRKQPLVFTLAQGTVIKGLEMGVSNMKKGGRAVLTCFPQYAYGESGYPPKIPPNSTLKFDVELLDWIGEDLSPNEDGGIEKVEVLQPGHGYLTPKDGSQVDIHIRGEFEGRVFEDRDVSFIIGEGSEENIIEGVERSLVKLRSKECVRLKIKPKYAFDKEGHAGYNIPPNALVEYVITLKNFEKTKDLWALDLGEIICQCKLFKGKGTQYFKNGKFDLANKLFIKMESYLQNEKDNDPEIEKERKTLLLAAYLNSTLCNLKMNNFYDAKAKACRALSIEPKNEKGLYRRGQALMGIGDVQNAYNDFAECLKIDPKNLAAKSQLAVCNKILKEQLQKEKKVYANMFDKFAKMDTQREESAKEKEPNVMSCVGEWGKEDREREPSEFEKENPNILMLNSSGEFKDM